MFARVSRTLEQLFATSSRRPRPRARTALRPRLGVEPLEDRLALSHFGAAAVVAHEQFTNHFSPANEAARLALLSQLAHQNVPHHAAPPVSPAPAPTPPPVHTTPPPANPTPPPGIAVSLQGTLRTGVVAPGGETTGVVIETTSKTYELDFGNNTALRNAAAALNGQQVQVTGNLTVQPGIEIPERFIVHVATLVGVPTPKPSPIPPPVGVSLPGINPATYVPDLCTTATFSGIMGPDGHYSSFSIVGHNPATGTTVVIGYSTGTPYGAPVYHWAVTVDSQTLGNWGNAATVYQPYYVDFLPNPVTYRQPGYGP